MKNKKFKLAIIGIIFHVVIAAFFCIVMHGQIKAKTFLPQNWTSLWVAMFVSFNAILGAFGAANSIDKKTMINNKQDPTENQE